MTVLAKTCIVCTKTEFNFIDAAYRHTHYLSTPVYQVLNVNWSAFLKGILLTLLSHGWNNGTAPMEGANWEVEACISFH